MEYKFPTPVKMLPWHTLEVAAWVEGDDVFRHGCDIYYYFEDFEFGDKIEIPKKYER